MSEKKTLKRAVKAVWDEVKLLRSERAKLYEPADIRAAAEGLFEHAQDLKQLADEMSSMSAMPSEPTFKADVARAKHKRKKASES